MNSKSVLSWILVVIAFIGFLDASYLALEHFRGEIPPCTVLKGCEVVTTSEYAVVAGVPVALLGALYYLAMLLGAVWYVDRKDARVVRWLAYASTIGLLVSAYLVYLQLFVIHAICLYCMISATTSTVLCVLSWRLLNLVPKNQTNTLQ